MKLNLGCGSFILSGFDNLDAGKGWRAEYGLPYKNGGVEAITISHMFYAIQQDDYPAIVREIARVLAPGGVVRITDDDTEHPDSKRQAVPYPWSISLTGPRMMRQHLLDAGLQPYDVPPDKGLFRDGLIQNNHGLPPNVFFIEGIK